MISLPSTEELRNVAERVVWFEPPEQALAGPYRFMTYLMTYGTIAEIAVVRRYVDQTGFAEALDHAAPGIMDQRSWAYWNAMAGRYPTPPMPKRSLPGV